MTGLQYQEHVCAGKATDITSVVTDGKGILVKDETGKFYREIKNDDSIGDLKVKMVGSKITLVSAKGITIPGFFRDLIGKGNSHSSHVG